jgi:hypothetical protein
MLVKAKSLCLFEDKERLPPHEANPEFTACAGWFNSLRDLQQLHNIKFAGESDGSDVLAAGQFPGVLKKIVKEGGYSNKQVFSIDLFCLFIYLYLVEARTPRKTGLF